jgi:hypothetical protein
MRMRGSRSQRRASAAVTGRHVFKRVCRFHAEPRGTIVATDDPQGGSVEEIESALLLVELMPE